MLKLIKDMVKILAAENPRWAGFAAFVLLCALIAAAFALRPAPPDEVVGLYIDRLNGGDCEGAYKMVAQKRKDMDPDLDTLESFRRTTCRDITSSFAKVFVAPEDMEVETYADISDVDFYLCVLPVGYIRRVCSKHSATLAREGREWKINSLEIGAWQTQRSPRYERGETLVPSYSPEKRDRKGN